MKKSILVGISFSLLALLVLSACAGTPAEEEEHASAHWTYTGEDGPSAWGSLDEAYELCGSGSSQSPINIADPSRQDLANLDFSYAASAVNILNNGHAIQVNIDEGSTMTVDGQSYSLLQLHFHAPSEHAINGALFPAEMHLVHANADGDLAVVGVLFMQGAENAALDPIWEHLPAEEAEVEDVGTEINPLALLPGERESYRYSGSLTTPPCSEDVAWHVMANPIEVSAEQLAAYESIFSGTNRPVQDLNGRDIILEETP